MAVNLHQIKNYIRHFFTAKRKGHDVHSPFAYKLCEEVFYNTAGFYDFEKLEKLRRQLQNNETSLEVEDFGAGSKTFVSKQRRVGDIAKKGITTRRQSELLYRLVNFLNPKNVIELGTSIGLNTIYLARANNKSRIYSIEGSKKIYDFATKLISNNDVNNCELINGKFDEILPGLLGKLNTLDLFYVDGNHTYEATLKYFYQALEKKNNDSVFIFDDIYWSNGMTRAWGEIKKHHDVTLCIDTFHFGFIFFKKEIKEKVDLKMFVN